MAAPSPPPEMIQVFINSLTESRVLTGACDAVLVWEWLMLLPKEYRYIWRSEIRFTTVVFILLRYFTFVALGMFSWLVFWNGSEELCARMVPWMQIGPTIVLALAHTLVAVRLYALWDKNKHILAFLGSIILAQIGTQIWASTHFRAQPRVTPLINHCLPQMEVSLAVAWSLPMCFDTLALLLAVARLAKIWRAGGQSRLVRLLIRDQVLWYILIEAVSVLNILVAYVTPGPTGKKGRGVLVAVLTTLTSISVCRIVLNIRQTADEDRRTALPTISGGSDNKIGIFSFTKSKTGTKSVSVEPQTPVAPAFEMDPYSNRRTSHRPASLEKGRHVHSDYDDDDRKDDEMKDEKVAAGEWSKERHAL